MQPIISIVGKSKAGKTTLLESLIIELNQRGYKVAVIKHVGDDFELDKVGKDSWRLSQAGSKVVAISSSHKLAVIRAVDRDFGPRELSSFIGWDYDLILAEGFSRSSLPKIEVKQLGEELLCPPQQLLAIVTDEPLAVDVPQFAKDEIQPLADLIENRLQAQGKEEEVELFVNDTLIPLNQFVSNFLAKTLLGMVSALKGIKQVKSLHIWLGRKGETVRKISQK